MVASSGGYGKYLDPILLKLPLERRNVVHPDYVGRPANST